MTIKAVSLKMWLHRFKIIRWLMIALFLLGSALTGVAAYSYVAFVTAPVYSFKTGFSGFGIARNSSITPVSMTVGVSVNPPVLWFYYSFFCHENGTYNFIFAFPFYITRVISASEKNVSTNSTPYGSAIWLQYRVNNVSSYGAGHMLFGNFVIRNTFQEGTRGSYTIILPFGMGVNPEVTQNLTRKLQVPFYSGDVNVTLDVSLPGSFTPITSFPPSSRGPEPYPTPLNTTTNFMEWSAGTLQNSITIEVVDANEKSFYDYLPFASGVFFGIGIQLMFTIGYDWIRKWAR
jgi:hypothetical protein